jgi:hypothetical protein
MCRHGTSLSLFPAKSKPAVIPGFNVWEKENTIFQKEKFYREVEKVEEVRRRGFFF